MREVRYPPPTNITISISAPPSTTLPIHTVIDLAAKKVVATLPSTGNANRLKITLDGKYAFVSDSAAQTC